MELTSLDGLTFGSIVASALSVPLVFVINLGFVWAARNRLFGRIFFEARNKFIIRILLSAVCALIFGITVSKVSLTFFGVRLRGETSGLSFFSISLLLHQFSFAKVGIHGAEMSVSSGTDYSASLNICRNYFWFLGTGAFKLTGTPEFEKTILRCKDTSAQVRFLLSSPDNSIVADAEQRAGVSPGTYRFGITQSLKKLSSLKLDRNAKFSVRLYNGVSTKDFESFRMFFVDDDILLLSYNVYGNGDGRQTPQLIVRRSALGNESDGFYYAYRTHYERLWEVSSDWDFQEYL